MTTSASDLRYLSPPAVGKQLGVDPARVILWIRQGKLRAINLSDGAVRPRFRVDPSDLQEFLRAREVVTNPSPVRRRRKNPNVIQFY